MRTALSSFISGLIFSTGLCLSGMTQPQKIIGFLNFTGSWDPSLMFVMGGALGVHLIAYRLIMKRASPLFDSSFHIPKVAQITPKLVVGSAIFGVGWGLGGFCPGPALTSLGNFQWPTAVFVICMLLGMWLAKLFSSSSAT